jgi:hypothetical protein
MGNDISPTSQGKLRAVLPSLQAIFVVEVVQRFPVIESLITILYWSYVCREDMGEET